ncbi:hypothetical protein [Bradyrhizobium sp. WU425]|uniref:hypothetical protein n=1 Tax=Bradyrhizobium sp. WU425 TaxID=187029 RepID=UPI001E62959F|nr:hypothetical protein [Bradyrhizobium canariense]UFW72956.1 hypothetical protein BcanWU425_04075 [Bradyrhizobium canariense]
MLIDTQMANQMQDAIDEPFRTLPEIYKTDEVKLEIARAVAFSTFPYQAAARRAIIQMFATLDRAVRNRRKLANHRN